MRSLGFKNALRRFSTVAQPRRPVVASERYNRRMNDRLSSRSRARRTLIPQCPLDLSFLYYLCLLLSFLPFFYFFLLRCSVCPLGSDSLRCSPGTWNQGLLNCSLLGGTEWSLVEGACACVGRCPAEVSPGRRSGFSSVTNFPHPLRWPGRQHLAVWGLVPLLTPGHVTPLAGVGSGWSQVGREE